MSAGRVAYLVNQYPKTSHSFVRREIAALEALGWEVLRYSIRAVSEPLVETRDVRERERTRVLLDRPWPALATALAAMLCTRPRKLLGAFTVALGLWLRADSFSLRPLGWLIEACVLERELRRARIAHLHAHFGSNSAAVALLVRALGGPGYSFTVHGTSAFDAPLAISLREKVLAARFVVAVSDLGRAQLMRWTPHEQWSKLHVVPCGLDVEQLERPPTPPVAAPRLVCVARLSAEKGIAVLLHALARMQHQGQVCELALVGDGELRTELEALARRLGIADRVHWLGLGDQAAVRREIAAARCLVAPSLAEGLPVVIMEAFALGRPVVASAVGAIGELVVPGRSGWLVPAGAVDELAAALCEALSASRERLEQLARSGREAVLARHDVRLAAARLAELFAAGGAEGAR